MEETMRMKNEVNTFNGNFIYLFYQFINFYLLKFIRLNSKKKKKLNYKEKKIDK